jgi:hypothetical protein
MKAIHTFILGLLLTFAALPLMADVAIEGETDIHVELLNGDKFPGYRFFIHYQSHYYEYGYQPGAVTNIYLEPGKHTATSDRDVTSLIYAEGPDGEIHSSKEVGGTTIDHTDGLAYILQRIKITKVGPEGIAFKVEERQLIGEDGKVIRTIKKGSLEDSDVPLDRQRLLIWLIPIVSMVGLLVFFLFRRKGSATA